MHEPNALNDSTVLGDTALHDVANCLKAYLQIHGATGRPFEILQFLADHTILHLEAGKLPRFNNLAIQDAVMGEIGKDASAWLSPLWKKLSLEILPRRAEGLEKFARDQGLEYYPWISKTEGSGGSGNQALYFLEAKKVSKDDPLISHAGTPIRADITYIPAINITPSWWASYLFDRDYSARGWRKGLYIWTPVIWILIVGALCMFLWVLLSRSDAPVTSQSILFLILTGIMLLYCRHILLRFLRLVEDRIVLAPDNLVGFREFGVCVELAREQEKDKKLPRVLRLVKYAAQCPMCGAEMLLDEGEPDFPRRIVGRCQESPREHIYSFDRVTRAGMRLRGVGRVT